MHPLDDRKARAQKKAQKDPNTLKIKMMSLESRKSMHNNELSHLIKSNLYLLRETLLFNREKRPTVAPGELEGYVRYKLESFIDKCKLYKEQWLNCRIRQIYGASYAKDSSVEANYDRKCEKKGTKTPLHLLEMTSSNVHNEVMHMPPVDNHEMYGGEDKNLGNLVNDNTNDLLKSKSSNSGIKELLVSDPVQISSSISQVCSLDAILNALYIYTQALNKLNSEPSVLLCDDHHTYAQLNINTGIIKLARTEEILDEISLPFNFKRYVNVERLFLQPIELKVGIDIIKSHTFGEKLDMVLRKYLSMLDMPDLDLMYLISYNRYKKEGAKAIVEFDHISNELYSWLAQNRISKFLNDVITHDTSVLKKAVLLSHVLACNVRFISLIDLSYFKDKKEYFYLKWTEKLNATEFED